MKAQKILLSLSFSILAACGESPEMLLESTDAATAAVLAKRSITTDPLAVCNDGSPAVYYVRPGANANRNNWIIHLKGGNSCNSWQRCNVRQPSRMSSNSYNNTMIGEGIMLDNAAMNPNWHDWNHVFFRYCSSDNWAGDAEQFCDASNDPTCPTDPSLRWKDGDSIQFRGRRILQAAIQELQRTSLPYVGTQERRMPDLDDANYVLFSGSSSGSIGMRTNLDWVANHLRSQNPNLTIRGVSDSAFTFSRSATITPTGCDFATPTSFPVYDFFGAPFVDETCAAGAAAAGDPIQVCSNLQYMLGCNSTKTNYYETPFFVQMDISDANAMGSMGYQRQDPAQLAEFRQKQLDFLFDTIDKTSRDWAPLGVDGIGLFSINIGSHTALMADDKFFGGPSRWRINGQTYSETLYNWLTDGNLKHCVSLGTTGCF